MATTEHFRDGGSTTFAFVFPILANSDLNVEVYNATTGVWDTKTENTSGQTDNDYTISNTDVVFNSATPSGTGNVHIYRTTNVDNSQAVFAAGSSIRAQDLNNNQTQVLYSTQEAVDQVVRTQDLKDLSITTAKLVDGSVTAAKLADNAFTNAYKTKVDGIETGATADQTDTEIRDAVGSASNSNIFTDADHTKLDNIESGATGDQTASEIRTLVGSASNSHVFTDADHTKLDGIEASATADQTDSEIRALVESASDSNVFTDADHSKLNNIESNATADQTGSEIKSAYEAQSNTNAFTDSEKTKLSSVVTETDAQTLTNKTLTSPVINNFSGTGIVTSGTSTSDNQVYSAKRSDELYSTQASAAASSASAAATSETNAATSETNAATSATNAATSASTATTQATTATTQATNAATSATTASTQATNAATSATTASTQASNAATSATTSSTQASNAATSASNASTSETNASASATLAQSYRDGFNSVYLGALANDPISDTLGNSVTAGDLYLNTTNNTFRVYNGSTFDAVSSFSRNSFESPKVANLGVFKKYAVITDTKTAPNSGGSFYSNYWRVRDLNTEQFDDDNITTIANNQFTLQAGTYFIKVSALSSNVGDNQLRIYNATDSSEVARGSVCQSITDGSNFTATAQARVTITSAKAFEIQHIASQDQIIYGFGLALNGSAVFDNQTNTQDFLTVEIYKESDSNTTDIILGLNLVYTAAAGSNTIDFGSIFTTTSGLADENISNGKLVSLAEGSSTFNLATL